MTPSIFSFPPKTTQAGGGADARLSTPGSAVAPGAFANQLQLQQQLQAPPQREVPRPPPPAPAPPPHSDAAPEESDAAARRARQNTAPQRPRTPTPQAPRTAEAPPAERAAQVKDPASATKESESASTEEAATPGARRERTGDTGTEATTPLNWMLQWVGAAPQAEGAEAKGGAHKGLETALGRAGKGPGGAQELGAEELPGPAMVGFQPGGEEAWQAALMVHAEGQAGGPLLAQGALGEAATDVSAVGALAATSAASGLSDMPAPTQVNLESPVNSPEFRDELAAQLTTFTQDGIHDAVLNLNPADMGPITVQIALDGTQAMVDFQASNAATRELIESSLPDLARALHSEGLTLSGGSVGDQRASSQGDSQPQERRGQGRGGNEPVDNLPARVTTRRTVGALDLYA